MYSGAENFWWWSQNSYPRLRQAHSHCWWKSRGWKWIQRRSDNSDIGMHRDQARDRANVLQIFSVIQRLFTQMTRELFPLNLESFLFAESNMWTGSIELGGTLNPPFTAKRRLKTQKITLNWIPQFCDAWFWEPSLKTLTVTVLAPGLTRFIKGIQVQSSILQWYGPLHSKPWLFPISSPVSVPDTPNSLGQSDVWY